MKKLFITLSIATLMLGACKKTYNNYAPELKLQTGETEVKTDAEILAINNWVLSKSFGVANGDVRQWTFRSGDKVTFVNQVDYTIFWKYKEGDIFTGANVIASRQK